MEHQALTLARCLARELTSSGLQADTKAVLDSQPLDVLWSIQALMRRAGAHDLPVSTSEELLKLIGPMDDLNSQLVLLAGLGMLDETLECLDRGPELPFLGLLEAIKADHSQVVVALLERVPVQIDAILCNAVRRGTVSTLKLTLEWRRDTGLGSPAELEPALLMAARQQELDKVELLLAHGAPNVETVMAEALEEGRSKVVELLVRLRPELQPLPDD